MNTSIDSVKCVTTILFLTDIYNLSIYAFRIASLLLNIVWFIAAVTTKEFHNIQMAYLFNLNVIGMVYCFIALGGFFINTCQTINRSIAYYTSLNGIFIATLSGYGLSGFAIHRLSCHYVAEIKTVFTPMLIIGSIALIWILPAVFSIIQLFAFETNAHYVETYHFWLIDTSKSVYSFHFFAFTNTILPNLVIISACVLLARKLKSRFQRRKCNRRAVRERPRIIMQLAFYVILFELSCFANLVIYYQVFYGRNIVSANTLKIMLIFKWLHLFCPFFLLFSHPALVKKLKMFSMQNK